MVNEESLGLDEEQLEIECPQCGKQISASDDECDECGFDISNWLTDEKIEELLSQIDDETFELKEGDPDSIIETIKQFAPKKERDDSEIVYECPLCGAQVSEDDTECPGCGAIFEE
ncbi:MAG: zinc ribbon domain-containing protein [Candidatus Saliniplasma sp.]